MKKFYDYHKNHGHNTEQCQNLRYLLESMVRAGETQGIHKMGKSLAKGDRALNLGQLPPIIVAIFSFQTKACDFLRIDVARPRGVCPIYSTNR